LVEECGQGCGSIAGKPRFGGRVPSAVEMQGHIAHFLGVQPWELRTKGE